MNKINTLFILKAGAVLSSMTLLAGDINAEETFPSIDAPKTVKALGKNPTQKDDGRVSFEIDASRIGNMEYLFSKRIAVIFDGAVTQGRKCPFIRTDDRDPKYTEIGNRLFRVESSSTPEEIELVKKEGCLITNSPPISKIMGSKNNPSPSQDSSP